MDSGIPITMNVEPSGSGNNGGFGGWGGDGAWWIIILFLFVFCGWGNGFGGFGGMGGGSGLQGMATRADINEGFALNNLQSGINAIQQGICDATYSLNNAMQSGFNGVQMQITNIGAQLQQCCCNIQTLIQDINYNMAKNTCDITNTMNMNSRDQMENTNNGFRAIMDKLSQMEYNGLNDKYQAALAENQALRFAASQTSQNQFITQVGNDIVQQLQPTPKPCWLTCSPYQSATMYANALSGNNCNCGGCGC